MNQTLLAENKRKLLAEQKRILGMLKRDTIPDSEVPGGHKPKFDEVGREEGENAFESEKFGDELSVTEDLESQLAKIERALTRIENGNYGVCVVGEEPIEEDRLRAEPAAETCITHSK